MDIASDSGTTAAPSVCPLDCADACSLSISTSGGRVTDVRGSHANPFTRGKLCAKVSNALAAQVHDRHRIYTPLLRHGSKRGGELREITWEQALGVIAERFGAIIERWGAEAIAPLRYGGPMGLLAGSSMDRRFFHRLGATRVDSTPLCAGTSSAAWDTLFGDAGGIDFEELAHSKLILVWGNNVTTCNLHVTTILRDARQRGAKLVVVDPKRIRIARDADLHIPLLPGTDVVLAYAVANLLAENGGLDRDFIAAHVAGAEQFLARAREFPASRAAALCGIEEAAIRGLAELLAQVTPAAMSIGVAPERNRNGGSGVRAALSLLALTGNIGALGAGPCDVSRFFDVDGEALARPDLALASVREISVLDVPRYVLEPGEELPLRGLFIYNHNPVAVHPEQARMRAALLSDEVFVVGSDVSMTDSMACADLVLPATSHLEYGDLYTAYGHRYLQRSEPVLAPQGEARTNMQLFRDLAGRFGFADACFGDSDEMLMAQALRKGTDLHRRALDGAVDMSDYAEPAMLRGAQFSTPSGRIELFSHALQESDGDGLPRYRELPERREFIVVSPASELRINSTFGGVAAQQSDLRCEIHPEDAARHSLGEGDRVVLHNARGEVEFPVLLSDAVRRGTLYVPKGAWMADSHTGHTVNVLIPGHRADLAGGACYYDCSVDIRNAAR